jgi:RIP metalloprotease RseP
MTLIYIICALIGIGLIIFIHEAGHFMAAKKVGVRVERFAIGFDPPFRGRNLRFLTFQRGETEYVIGMIPFGGYVKRAGETLMAGDGEGKSDELISKSVGGQSFQRGHLRSSAVFLVRRLIAAAPESRPPPCAPSPRGC